VVTASRVTTPTCSARATTAGTPQTNPRALTWPDDIFGKRNPDSPSDSFTSARAFSPCDCLAVVKDVDGLGEVSGVVRAAAQLRQDLPGLEQGVRAFIGPSELGVSAVVVLLRLGLVLALVGRLDVRPPAR
jgi:hypothetical protein